MTQSSKHDGICVKIPPELPIDPDLWRAVACQMELSPQHAHVVELILRGLSDKQITEAMGIHQSTLRTYLERIAARTGATGRVGILRMVLAVSHRVRQ